MGRLLGKTALVTGIGSGIGKACAMMFAREGATVVGCDINVETAERTVVEARQLGLTIESVHPIDLLRPAEVEQLIDHVGRAHGRIDVLLNAAAIPPHTAPIATMDFATQWAPTIAGEVDVVFLACNSAWPWLLKSGSASIINFSSTSASRSNAIFGAVAHCAAKGAVAAMSRQIAREGGPHGIRCNTIAPGVVLTPTTERDGALDEELMKGVLARMPAGRLGQPDDIAWCAVYLASDEARWVTGANFAIDGGYMAC